MATTPGATAPSPAGHPPKVPDAVEVELPNGVKRAIQVNFCKNPKCSNFGVPASGRKYSRVAAAGGAPGSAYRVNAAGKDVPILTCLKCSETVPIKGNGGIAEEIDRLFSHHRKPALKSCVNPACSNFRKPISDKLAYKRFGTTARGAQRYRCLGCQKTLSVPKSAVTRQRLAHKNQHIFRLLMNKSPFSRICEVAQVSIQTVYDKLDFIERQCLKFAARKEAALLAGFSRRRVYVATDRQDYAINWTRRKDKKNIVLRCVGSADLASGYVFGMHLNFDSSLDSEKVEEDAKHLGDYGKAPAFRQFSRLWLAPDYDRAVTSTEARLAKTRKATGTSLTDAIAAGYLDAEAREDVESADAITNEIRFPTTGAQVRNEYTLYAHFYYLHAMLKDCEGIRFFLDQESGIRAACFAAFEEEISKRKCDAFYVKIGKELRIDDKRRLIKASRARFQAVRDANPTLNDAQIQILMMKEEMARAASLGKWSDRWLAHPWPNLSEPDKAMCYLTDSGDLEEDHLAALLLKATLRPIDRFFMLIRRRLSLLERPISSSSNFGRTWYGYSAYQPGNIEKILNIFRVYYNWVLAGDDGNTPAMRLGLTDKPVDLEDILAVV